MDWFRPVEHVSEEDLQRGLRSLLYDGICSQIMGSITGGAFLVAFALLLGAPNTIIGLIAAAGPLSQIAQIPAIFMVEKIRLRRLLVVGASLASRLFWILIAALPFIAPESARVPIFISALIAYFAFGAVSGCAFNSWMRDLIPERIMGKYFGRRLSIATAAGAGLSLAAGVGVDLYQQTGLRAEGVYSILFLLGATAGLLGVFFLSRIPEPRMSPPTPLKLRNMLAEPFRDANFKRLLLFLASWNFAVTLAGPFFVVYMLTRLELSMTWILALAVGSQALNVFFFRIWGRLADRFTNKSVLSVSAPMFIVSIALWPFTTLPDRWAFTIPLLILIHVLTGMSTAGVMLSSSNIALKAAPKGKATAFLATNAIMSGLAGSVGPILGGVLADVFQGRQLRLAVDWLSHAGDEATFRLHALDLQGLDFVFAISVICGLYAWHRLLGVREEGEVEETVVIGEFTIEVRKAVQFVANVPGIRQFTYFPFARLREVIGRRRTRSET